MYKQIMDRIIIKEMKIKVKISGNIFGLELDDDITLAKFKDIIGHKYGVSPTQVRVVFNKGILKQENNTLKNLGVKDSSIVCCIIAKVS